MKTFKFWCLAIFALTLFSACTQKREGKPKVLVFTKTAGFKHGSIPQGVAAIKKLGTENGFAVDTTSQGDQFNEANLSQYASVIFLSTTGNVLDNKQEAAFERYIQAGGSFVGIHAAADTEYDWRWYGKLVGGYFKSHPATQEADFVVKDFNFPATAHFTDSVWHRRDELYNYKLLNPDVNVLVTLDESSYEGGENGDFHPIAWYHEFDGGRAFYTGLGHTDESFSEEPFLKHLLGGIQYAMGENLVLDYKKATTQIPPDGDRFYKTPLVTGVFDEPTEMTILPNLDILVVERKGGVKLYKNGADKIQDAGHLNVYHKTSVPGVNAEEGVMGLQADPNFIDNNWVYVFYSPKDTSVNRLSRFDFRDDKLQMDSEKVILDVWSQRQICCHTGGSIAFGGDGLLYLSTGDNTTPFNEPGVPYVNSGFAPLNDLPGKAQYDARRSSANTNDLRGKILRIKINDDATYTIPEGNLFPEGTAGTRPEIYTMGHRNPYRISVDQKNGHVFWGDVGPDAQKDSLATRGPRGYDEINRATEAGNFGWPLFAGNNTAYRDYDYATGQFGEPFKIDAPINDSANNTGLKELPPAQGAMVWYSYDPSGDFPQIGSGGKNPMAGPVYYADMFPGGSGLPDYYDGKFIAYEWMRGWMMAISFFPNGEFKKMEPFAPNVKVSNLIDMEIGPDGHIYLLEYGSGWFRQNADSGLARLDYEAGNRPPLVGDMTIDHNSGKLPLTVKIAIEAEDREGDALSYSWNLGKAGTVETTEPTLEYTFKEAGEYPISVSVTDPSGESISSVTKMVYAGNSRPTVEIELEGGDRNFFVPGQPIGYKVTVSDPDGENIAPERLYVAVDYLSGMDEASMDMGHQETITELSGEALTRNMDCKACHKKDGASIGPSYLDVSKKYAERADAKSYLSQKIKNGGTGVWGEVMMPAHVDISDKDLNDIVNWILSLGQEANKKTSLPAEGSFIPESVNAGESLVLSATYTDAGAQGVRALTGGTRKVLGSNTLGFGGSIQAQGFSQVNFNNQDLLLIPADTGWFGLTEMALTGITSGYLTAGWMGGIPTDIDFEIRLESPGGQLLGKARLKAQAGDGQNGGAIPFRIKPITDGKPHTLYFLSKASDSEAASSMQAALMAVTFLGK
jgi:glucose/arabinose dehydrogenase/cytochrome c551/c552